MGGRRVIDCRLVYNITPVGRDVKAELSYPLSHRSEPALLRHALGEVDSHLGVNHTPVLPPSGPLLRDIHHGQIQHFQQAVIGGKYGFGFGHLAQLAVKSFDGVGRIDQASDCFWILPPVTIFTKSTSLFF